MTTRYLVIGTTVSLELNINLYFSVRDVATAQAHANIFSDAQQLLSFRSVGRYPLNAHRFLEVNAK